MFIKTETRLLDISLNLWRGGWNAGYEPDCFDDLGCIAREGHEVLELDDCGCDKAYIYTDKEANELISWWESECENANKGEDGDGLQGLTEDEIGRGDEWNFSAEDVTEGYGFGESLTGDSSIPLFEEADDTFTTYQSALVKKYDVFPSGIRASATQEEIEKYDELSHLRDKAWIKKRQMELKTNLENGGKENG